MIMNMNIPSLMLSVLSEPDALSIFVLAGMNRTTTTILMMLPQAAVAAAALSL